ncbi:hypothetical protein FHT29_005661 [Rhizobium sp. SG741]|nr:hypothetical protein [Rhizobium sp. SG741]NRP89172.1 hypothetical protein [Ensifer adhaerens]
MSYGGALSTGGASANFGGKPSSYPEVQNG